VIAVVSAAAALAGCSDDLPLSTIDQAATVSPVSIDFGAVTLGTEAGPRSITVSNGGFGSDTVESITSCPNFRVDLYGQTLPYEIYKICEGLDVAGDTPSATSAACEFIDIQTLQFGVFFRPTIANVESCNLVIGFTNAADKVVPMSGTGLPPPIDLTLVQPTSPTVEFGDVLAGAASAPRTITVRNDGSGQLDITSADAGGTAFSSTGTAPISLAAGQTADYQVVCTPSGAGLQTGTFRITSNDPDEGTFDIALRCNGIQSDLSITPSPATMPMARLGETTRLDINLVNTGTAALTIADAVVAGDGLVLETSPGGTQLAAGGGTTTATVGFTPIADGDVSGTLTVTYDGGQTRQIGITAPGRTATLSVTPSGHVDFGPICVGQAAAELFVALDTGTGGFVVDNVALAGNGFTLTPLSPPSYPAPVSPLGSTTVTFQVGAAPTQAGALEGQIAIDTDIPQRPAESIALNALGLAGGTTATPAELDAGAAAVGEGAGGRLVSLSNCEAGPLTITSVGFLGEDADEFAIVTTPTSPDVEPGATAAWLVELRPRSTGAKTATFHIVHSRGTADIVVTGDGLDDTGHAGGDPRGSYYACRATGGDGGWGVIALAIGLAIAGRRPRRRSLP
jgi:hypothetical protein